MDPKISLIGCTGSIGRQTLDVADNLGLPVEALAANNNVKLMAEQARRFKPKFAAMGSEETAKELRLLLRDMELEIGWGAEGLARAAAWPTADCLVTAVSGSVGLKPTLAAIDAKKRIAIANKETLVCAGSIVTARAKASGAVLVPVDSEHSAIFQCMSGRDRSELRKILLTGSGGPFRGRKRAELAGVTPQQAVSHPNWSMGAKISVDSSTLMNKGLEFIEAMHLFAVRPEDIQVVIHPQSLIHSMVELVDGTVIAQMGCADMRMPIQYALTYPRRLPGRSEALDFWKMRDLRFEAPDLENFPCLRLAMDCARAGGLKACVMSAANEVAVHLFLRGALGYNRIYDCVQAAVDRFDGNAGDIDAVIEADAAAREFVRLNYGKN